MSASAWILQAYEFIIDLVHVFWFTVIRIKNDVQLYWTAGKFDMHSLKQRAISLSCLDSILFTDPSLVEPCTLAVISIHMHKSCTVIANKSSVVMKMTVFWDVAPCSLVEIYRRFRDACCLHHQVAMMMEAVSISVTSVNFYQAARPNISEESSSYSPP
jgi:hypothetical protein